MVNKLTHEDVLELVNQHQIWLQTQESSGTQLNLDGCELYGINLDKLNLSRAIMTNMGMGKTSIRHSNLSYTDLSGSNIGNSDLTYTNLYKANLSNTNLCKSNLTSCNLKNTNLFAANLRGADLSNTLLDFSCFPLWCGGTNFKIDVDFLYQMLAHMHTFKVKKDEMEEFQEFKKLTHKFAHKSHRYFDLNTI